MTSRSQLFVRQPRERLRDVLVARTWELAELLDEIESVELEARRGEDGIVRSATHRWRARADVPAVLAPHLDADYFAWTATVEWRTDSFASRWRIEPHAVRESLLLSADVSLEPAIGGRGSRVAIEATIDGLDGRKGIESIAYRIVLVNWRKLVEAADRRLAEA